MKQSITVLLLLLAILSTAVSAPPLKSPSKKRSKEPPITKEVIRQVIEIFRAEPASEKGRAAASLILRFGEESPDVAIEISPTVVPWLSEKPAPRHVSELMTAYLAGNIRSQLDSGISKADPVAGEEQVIETYLLLKKTEPTLRVASVEKFIELKAQGKLKEHFESR